MQDKRPLGFRHSHVVLDIDIDKVCDDHPNAPCMVARCDNCIDAATLNIEKVNRRRDIRIAAETRIINRMNGVVEDTFVPPPPPPPVRKISNGKPLHTTEDVEGMGINSNSIKEWLLPNNYSTSLIFFIGGCIVGSMFTTVFSNF